MNQPVPELQNVVILVGDAVRWDYSGEFLSSLGPTLKTVSASLHTPTSFATMFSGIPADKHPVTGFSQRFSGSEGLFAIDGYDVDFGTGHMNDWIASDQQIFGPVSQKPLADASQPFLWINRDGGGHAPYGKFEADGQGFTVNAREYLMEHAGDETRLREDYASAIESFHRRVEDVISSLEDRGIAEDTLVIVTSDHGELLGEHGQIGHDFPAAPELVYVPTCFIHPALDGELIEDDLFRHIDLLPTILDALGEEVPEDFPGRRLFSEEAADYGVSVYDRSLGDFAASRLRHLFGIESDVVRRALDARLGIESVWDLNGGHVRHTAPKHEQLIVFALRLLGTPEGRHVIRSGTIREAYRTIVSAEQSFGNPGLEFETAFDKLSRRERTVEGTDSNLDEAARQRLEDMGYI